MASRELMAFSAVETLSRPMRNSGQVAAQFTAKLSMPFLVRARLPLHEAAEHGAAALPLPSRARMESVARGQVPAQQLVDGQGQRGEAEAEEARPAAVGTVLMVSTR
jgi:hypothetical protein